MSTPPPVELRPGMEIVPGYTLLTPLGSGMAGDVWQAQAAGGIKVALKVVRSLSVLGGRKELKALKTIRDVHHPNLCPLFGFWTKDTEGRVLADGETEDLTLDSVSSDSVSSQSPDPSAPNASGDSNVAGHPDSTPMDGTMAIGQHDTGHAGNLPPDQSAAKPEETEPAKPKVKAEQLIVVMGLGDCTLFDRLTYVRNEAGIPPGSHDVAHGLGAEESIRYLRSSASAIDLLNQEHQIYHCDIKPQNILLVGGEAQVCDFGLAKHIEGDMRQTQQAFATPAYAPPEVLHNEGYSRQVDQYSLAVTYYELRTGLLPFDITTHASMLVAKSTGKLNLDALSPPERKVLQKALQRVPNQRFDSCTEFINALAVAAGVDKSGGITIGRILAAVAGLIALVAIGLGAWRLTAPEHFRSVFFTSEIFVAESLGKTKLKYQNTESESFVVSQLTLVDVMETSAKIAEDAEGDVQQDARRLFGQAAMRLVTRIHETLGRVESDPEAGLTKELQTQLQSSLQQISPGRIASEPGNESSLIESGLVDWAASDVGRYSEYESLYYAAAVRFDNLRGQPPKADQLVKLRVANAERPEDFGAASGVSPVLAALLPVLTTTPADQIADRSIADWLQPTRLNDLLTAEAATRRFGIPTAYATRWNEIRDAFTMTVEPEISMPTNTAAIDGVTRTKILEGFPDLRIQKQIAELRQSAISLRWDQVDPLLENLRSHSLREDQSDLVKLISILAQNRGANDALSRCPTQLKGKPAQPDQESITVKVRRGQRFGALWESYMTHIAQQAMTQVRLPPIFRELSAAKQIESNFDVTTPMPFLSAALVSMLQHDQEFVQMSAGEGSQDLVFWVARASSVPELSSLTAAIQLERQAFAPAANRRKVDEAVESLQRVDRQLLERVGDSYVTYLAAIGAALRAREVQPVLDRLTTASRASIASLGDSRLDRAVALFVELAVDASQVANGDLGEARYAAGSAPVSELRRASGYLELGSFLADHIQGSVPAALATETFLASVAATDSTAQLMSIRIPDDVTAVIDSDQSMQRLSTQVLKAVHQAGLPRLGDHSASDSSRATNVNLVTRTTTELLNRFGRDRFGFVKAGSPKKRRFVQSVIHPTSDQILDEDASKVGRLKELCAVLARLYADPEIRNVYDQLDQYLDDWIKLAMLGASDGKLAQRERDELVMMAALAAGRLDGQSGDDVLRLADQAKQVSARQDVVAYLSGLGNARLAAKAKSESEKAKLLAAGYQSALRGVAIDSGSGSGGPAQTEPDDSTRRLRYELLSLSTDLTVQLAFTRSDLNEKYKLLEPAVKRGESALKAYESVWGEDVGYWLSEAQVSLANVCEDIAHYCFADRKLGSLEERNAYFKKAIANFTKVRDQYPESIKARFSLGRCQYRSAIVLEGDAKTDALKLALESLGDEPTPSEIGSDDPFLATMAAEWYVWRIKTDIELKHLNDALELAERAFPLVTRDVVSIDQRNALSMQCGLAFGFNEQWERAERCLVYLGHQGPASGVVGRMKAASQIAFFGQSKNDQLMTEVMRILDRLPPSAKFPAGSDEADQLAEIASNALFDQVVGMAVGPSARQTNTLSADLSRGVRAFHGHVKPAPDRDTVPLAEVFQAGNHAFLNRDPLDALAFAADLSIQIRDDLDFPESSREQSLLMVLYTIGYWKTNVADADDSDSLGRSRELLTMKRHEALQHSLDLILKGAKEKRNLQLASEAKGAKSLIESLYSGSF